LNSLYQFEGLHDNSAEDGAVIF